MSISNPKIENPCKKFIEFKGDKGQFFFYDRENEQQLQAAMNNVDFAALKKIPESINS